MGGKTWSGEEELTFWRTIIPQSPKAVRKADRVHDWRTCAQLMQEKMREKARRRYNKVMLFEHYFQNVQTGHKSPHARKFVAEHMRELEMAATESLSSSSSSGSSSDIGDNENVVVTDTSLHVLPLVIRTVPKIQRPLVIHDTPALLPPIAALYAPVASASCKTPYEQAAEGPFNPINWADQSHSRPDSVEVSPKTSSCFFIIMKIVGRLLLLKIGIVQALPTIPLQVSLD